MSKAEPVKWSVFDSNSFIRKEIPAQMKEVFLHLSVFIIESEAAINYIFPLVGAAHGGWALRYGVIPAIDGFSYSLRLPVLLILIPCESAMA